MGQNPVPARGWVSCSAAATSRADGPSSRGGWDRGAPSAAGNRIDQASRPCRAAGSRGKRCASEPGRPEPPVRCRVCSKNCVGVNDPARLPVPHVPPRLVPAEPPGTDGSECRRGSHPADAPSRPGSLPRSAGTDESRGCTCRRTSGRVLSTDRRCGVRRISECRGRSRVGTGVREEYRLVAMNGSVGRHRSLGLLRVGVRLPIDPIQLGVQPAVPVLELLLCRPRSLLRLQLL